MGRQELICGKNTSSVISSDSETKIRYQDTISKDWES
jgi:hypothetical protein